MWHFITKFASPKYFYHSFAWFSTLLGWISLLFILMGLIAGLIFTPSDYQQGDAFRIIYIHVPAAFLSMLIFAHMGVMSFSLLVWRIKLSGMMIRALAPVGASMAFLALVSGSLWGKPMWGAYWVWDARLTSELVLFLLYLAVLAVSEAYAALEHGDKMMALLCLVGLIDLPIIHYSVYWWQTLHQGATLSILSKPKIHSSMLYPLVLMIIGFTCFTGYIVISKVRQMILWREKNSTWVRTIFLVKG